MSRFGAPNHTNRRPVNNFRKNYCSNTAFDNKKCPQTRQFVSPHTPCDVPAPLRENPLAVKHPKTPKTAKPPQIVSPHIPGANRFPAQPPCKSIPRTTPGANRFPVQPSVPSDSPHTSAILCQSPPYTGHLHRFPAQPQGKRSPHPGKSPNPNSPNHQIPAFSRNAKMNLTRQLTVPLSAT